MAVEWTAHRFSGGLLALDTANTVVMRGHPNGFDRFDDPLEIGRFAEAANRYRAIELDGCRLVLADPRAVAPVVRALREAIDGLFRDRVLTGAFVGSRLATMTAACATALAASPGIRFAVGEALPVAFEAGLAWSALGLLEQRRADRVRICGNCGWLFVDGSRNGSRIWCDMAVCGNRQKAKRFYRRAREAETAERTMS